MKMLFLKNRSMLAAAFAICCLLPGTATSAEPALPTTTVQRGDLRLFAHASGSIAWSTQIPVHAPMAGRIDQLNISEDQAVHKDECAAVISSLQRAVLMDVAQADGAKEMAKWENVYRPVPLLSPADGTAIKVSVVIGQNIGPEQVLFTIGDSLVARMYVEETEIPLVAMGGTATLTFDALPEVVVTGTVVRVGSQSTPYRNAIAYEVDLAVTAWPAAAKPGMSLNATFAGPFREQVLRVPCTAVTRIDGKDCVCLVAPDGSTSFQEVRTGLTDGVDVEIPDGLREGDLVRTDTGLQPKAGTDGKARYSPLLPYTREH